MKRIVLFLVTILVITVFSAVPTYAEASVTEVLMGTPVVDGELDALYRGSVMMYIIEDKATYFWGYATATDPYDGAYCYLLWDEDYIYLFAHNADATPFSYNDTFENKMQNKPFTNDGFETQFWVGDTLLYYFCAYVDGVHYADDGMSIENVVLKTKRTDDGWVIEAAIPTANLNLKAGDAFEMIYQVNNIHDEQGASGSAAYCAKVPLTISNKKATDTDGESTPTSSTTVSSTTASSTLESSDSVGSTPESTSPNEPTDSTPTNHGIIIGGAVVAIIAIAGAVLLISKKKK